MGKSNGCLDLYHGLFVFEIGVRYGIWLFGVGGGGYGLGFILKLGRWEERKGRWEGIRIILYT